MQKIFIQNRKNQKIAVLLDQTDKQTGLVFVMHGLGGFKEQAHIQTTGGALKGKGFTVVYFDTTNSFGQSDGNYEDATTTNYYEDLEDLIAWATAQAWYQEPFSLAGHSLGGICTAFYAEKYPQKVLALVPISTVVSGELRVASHVQKDPAGYKEWEETGWRAKESKERPGLIKRLAWSHMKDALKYDLLKQAQKLTMPILMIVGENDDTTPVDQQRILFKALPAKKKELHIIKGAPHTFRETEHLTEFKEIISRWIETFLQ